MTGFVNTVSINVFHWQNSRGAVTPVYVHARTVPEHECAKCISRPSYEGPRHWMSGCLLDPCSNESSSRKVIAGAPTLGKLWVNVSLGKQTVDHVLTEQGWNNGIDWKSRSRQNVFIQIRQNSVAIRFHYFKTCSSYFFLFKIRCGSF